MQTLMLIRVLRSCDHAVCVVCYFEYEKLVVNDFQNEGAEIILLELDRKAGFLQIILSLRNEIRKIDPDIVHIQYMAPGALPIIAARLAGAKTVFATVHQPFTKFHKKRAKIILRLVALLTTKFISVSLNAEKSWFGSSSLFDEKLSVLSQPRHFTIYNAVDITKIHNLTEENSRKALRKELQIPFDSTIIGTVSRISFEKGTDILLKAFIQLIRVNAKLHLLLVGSGPEEEKLRMEVNSNKLTDKVTFHEKTDWIKAMKLLSLMDIVAIPSRFEGFGLTAAEAMAASRPVVAADCFGLKEIVENEKTGLLFRQGDYSDLASKMSILISDSELMLKFRKEGRNKVENTFSLEIYKRRISGLYNLSKKRIISE
jgi:L-malate glycosyltransferase